MNKVLFIGGIHFKYWITALEERGFSVTCSRTVDEAIEIMNIPNAESFDLIIIDMYSPHGKSFSAKETCDSECTGKVFVERYASLHPKTRFILMSSDDDGKSKQGRQITHLPKPVNLTIERFTQHVKKTFEPVKI